MSTRAERGALHHRRPLPRHVRRHSRMVAAMRLALPVLAAVLLAALALWSKLGLDGQNFILALQALGPQRVESMSMSNPHFSGIDDKKRPFSVTAKEATQLDRWGDLVDLKEPQADITLENGSWVSLSSDQGRYHRQGRILDLTGAVNVYHDQGYELHTRDVKVNLADSKATGHEAVEGQGPAGDLTAEGIELTDAGKRVFLLGRTHMVLNASDQQLDGAVPLP